MRYNRCMAIDMSAIVESTVTVVDIDAIRILTLHHPAKKNALTRDMLARLPTLLPTSHASPTQPIRAVIIEGYGATFSSGFDLAALNDERKSGVDPIAVAADAIAACPVAVIAAVDGDCYGGAVELVAACSIRVSSSAVRFAVPAVRLGLVYPASGLRRFRRVLGTNTERVLLSGSPFFADDARAWGLVHDVVIDARAHARSVAADIAAAAPLAVAGTLEALRAIDANAADDVIAAIRQRALDSDDLAEGVIAVKEKRPAIFAGR